MGFSFSLPCTLDSVVNPTEDHVALDITEAPEDIDAEDDVEEAGNTNDTDVADFLPDQFGEDMDVEEFATEEQYLEAIQNSTNDEPNDERVARELDMLNTTKEAIRSDLENERWIQQQMRWLLPEVNGQETTLQAFHRLTNDKSLWIPFRMPNSTSPSTKVDLAEYALFDEMKLQYNPIATTGPTTYKRFMAAWNNQVTKRFEDWC
jgi:hypothetical protein